VVSPVTFRTGAAGTGCGAALPVMVTGTVTTGLTTLVVLGLVGPGSAFRPTLKDLGPAKLVFTGIGTEMYFVCSPGWKVSSPLTGL
jgi:hypothetical protein